MRLKMSEMPVLLFWHLSTAGLKAGDTLSSAVFFSVPKKNFYRSDSLRQKLIIDKFCESDLTFDSDSEASDSED